MQGNNYEFNFVEVLRLLGKPVNFYPNMARAIGNDPGCALFLSNFYYWEGKQEDKDGWIYKAQSEIYRETGLTRSMQERARKKLRELGILEEELKKMPAVIHYRFNWDKVNEVLDKYFKGVTIDKEKPEHPLLYLMREAFNEKFLKEVKIAYEWGSKGQKKTKDQTGKDWIALKNLADIFKRRIKEKKLERQDTNTEIEISDAEIVENFKMFLNMLPAYHIQRNLIPWLLYVNFNKILLDIRNGNSATNQGGSPSTASDYV